jgi:hypothetical protein
MSEFAPGQPPTLTAPTFTLGEAAKAVGLSKPTLSKAITSGRLSAEKDQATGVYTIQAAELFRVYPPNRQGNREATSDIDAEETGVTEQGNPGLAAREVDRLRKQLADQAMERDRERRQLEDQISDLRRRLDLEGEERRKLTAILTDQRTRPPEPEPEPEPAPPVRRGLWSRLTGRG